MAISSGLATKAGIGAAFVGLGGTGIWFGKEYVSHAISKYEWALMEFLKEDGNDIIFTIKKGSGGDQELDENDISFASGSNTSPVTITATISADTSKSTSTFKTKDSGTSKLEEIKKKVGKNGADFTWECVIKFELDKGTDASKTMKEEYKNRIWKSTDSGLFGLLKKDTTTYTDPEKPNADNKWTKEDIKLVKSKFIGKCGYERGISVNKALNGKDATKDEIKVEAPVIKFSLVNDQLEPTDKKTFKYWFGEDLAKRQYHTTTTGS